MGSKPSIDYGVMVHSRTEYMERMKTWKGDAGLRFESLLISKPNLGSSHILPLIRNRRDRDTKWLGRSPLRKYCTPVRSDSSPNQRRYEAAPVYSRYWEREIERVDDPFDSTASSFNGPVVNRL